MFIYVVTNLINGKQYVGQTVRTNPEIRWQHHLADARKGKKSSFWAAIRKYGENAFCFDVVGEYSTQDMLNYAEQDWIDKLKTLYPNGYNLRPGGAKGFLHETTRERMRAVWERPGYRERMSSLLSKAQSRPDVKLRNSENNKRRFTEEFKAEHSKMMKEVMQRPEIKHNHLIGIRSEARKERIRDAIKIVMQRPGVREKYSEAAKRREARRRSENGA